MTPSSSGSTQTLFQLAGAPYFVIAFIARLPFAMMVVGVLTAVVAVRGSLTEGGLTSAAVGVGTAIFGPFLGAAADRYGQRPVLAILALANGAMLALFAVIVYSAVPEAVVLLVAFGIGATAPQVAPMSRSRLVTMIEERMPQERRVRTVSGTMAYESAADETVFVFGPFVVGLLASLLSPWAPLVGAAALTVLFVGAFALHPSGAHIATSRGSDGRAPSPVTALLRPALVVIVIGILGVGLFFGSMLTSLTAFMDERGVPEQAGLLYGVMGIGSAVLALAVAWFPPRFTLRARLLVFSIVLLLGTLLLPFVKTPGGMLFALAVIGVGIGPTLVTQYSFGAARSPAGRSATVMTMLGSAVIVGQALASAVTGALAESAGAVPALWMPILAGVVVVVTAVINWPLSTIRRRVARPR